MNLVSPRAIAIIGAGPRGLSTLERLVAQLDPARDHVTIHLIDPHPPGGRVWQAGQNANLLMNTTAGDATLYLDETVETRHPRPPGLDLYTWAQHIDEHVAAELIDAGLRAEIAALRPVTSVSRRLYGIYLGWAFTEISSRIPDGCRVVVVPHSATRLRRTVQAEVVSLSNGEELMVDAVVLAVGHTDAEHSIEVQNAISAARQGDWLYVPPGQPAEQDWSAVAPGENVIVRGLGLNFFDTMAMLTLARGGRFVARGESRLEYLPSGQEPVIWAGSRRGVPFKAKAIVEERLPAQVRRYPDGHALQQLWVLRGRLDFDSDIWPWIRKEALWQAALVELGDGDPVAVADLTRSFDAEAGSRTPDLDKVRADFGLELHFDPERSADPLGGKEFGSVEDLSGWTRAWVEEDLDQARRAILSPVKEGDRAIGSARAWVFPLASYGGLPGTSYRRRFEGWYAGYANSLAGGPPALRLAQLAALIEAGVVRMLGAGLRVSVDEQGPLASSASLPGVEIRGSVLVEARLADSDITRTTNPLLRSLLDEGRCRPYRLPSLDGSTQDASGFEVTEKPFHLVEADGQASGRVFAIGIPVGPHVGTSFTAFARSNSVFLRQTDAVAEAALKLTRG
ncbi:FAD/NAD(P)-binding protein [Kineosporia babensis]|uniref:FAD/NAD(P)-binding protein n=1 Tax=Kineosporia babensis TaxID=499548 RepID=A0A9X1NFD2_9ACTN|nr:FAD/NAD(P)-binding protein [Kineosporia babensis]MCD5314102.1 FAD/NAD(P)-binding protein [Kineosporia babensis]